MRVSKNFNRDEFSCKCGCGFDAVDTILLKTLQKVRDYFSKKYPNRKISITITSGNRCSEHNTKIGGSKNSYHIKAMAADFIVNDVHESEVFNYLYDNYPYCFGIGRYTGRTHLDSRLTPARWDNRTQ